MEMINEDIESAIEVLKESLRLDHDNFVADKRKSYYIERMKEYFDNGDYESAGNYVYMADFGESTMWRLWSAVKWELHLQDKKMEELKAEIRTLKAENKTLAEENKQLNKGAHIETPKRERNVQQEQLVLF